MFERLSPTRAWHIEVHQFRIEARPGEPGQPTPEGMHRDGVDFVLVLLVRRQNVRSGVTSIRSCGASIPMGSTSIRLISASMPTSTGLPYPSCLWVSP